MSQLFEVDGLSLGNAISILYGVSAPGVSQDTIDAQRGSVYFDTSGVTWKKISMGAGTAAWAEAGSGSGGGVSGINSLRNVTGNNVVDSLDATVMDTGVWAITTSSVTNPLNHQTVIVTGSHNGAVAKYSLYSRMDFGTKIQGITYDVRLVGGNFELVVFAPVFCNIDCYRLNAVSNGSTVTLVGGGGGGGGGTGDVTTAQLNAAINSAINTEVVTRISVDNTNANAITAEATARAAADTALDAKISTKADITGLATQFSTINANVVNVANAVSAETAARIAAIAALPTSTPQVNSDWNSLSGVSQILNKPTVPTVVSALTNDIGYQTAAQVSTAIAAIPSGGVSTVNYNFAVDILGSPVSNSLVGLYISPASFDLSGGGVAKALTAATAQTVFTLKKNDTNIGTVTFAAGSAIGVVAVTPTSLVANDELVLLAPVTDDTLADIAITFIGSGAGGGSGSSITKSFNSVAHGFTVGQSISRTSGVWVLASAASDATSEISGVVSAVTTDSFTLTFVGYISGLTGLVDGATYFLSTSEAGGATVIPPTASNTVSKPLYIAISATEAIVIQSRGLIN